MGCGAGRTGVINRRVTRIKNDNRDYSNKASTKAPAENGWRSSAVSPRPDKPDRKAELLDNRHDGSSLRRAIKLRENETGNTDRFVKLTGLNQRVLPVEASKPAGLPADFLEGLVRSHA
jgi:hypothetical protein